MCHGVLRLLETTMLSRLPLVTLLTDFGRLDSYVAVLKAVIAGILPAASVVDLSHDVPRHDIRAGAFHLLAACPYFPLGSVHIAVVDPGVGSNRRLVAVEAGGHYLVGPDNGLLRWIVDRLGPNNWTAVQLTERRYWLDSVSDTFHGRDILAPVAAHLARGVSLDQLGSPVHDLSGVPLPLPIVDGERLRGEILHVDHFGNACTNIRPGHLSGKVGKLVVSTREHNFPGPLRSYAAVSMGEPLAIWGSTGFLELALREGSAAAILRICRGDDVFVQ